MHHLTSAQAHTFSPTLVWLSIPGVMMKDFSWLSKLTELKYLNVRGGNFGDDDVEYLPDNLQVLDIAKTRITDFNLLKDHCKNLTRITLENENRNEGPHPCGTGNAGIHFLFDVQYGTFNRILYMIVLQIRSCCNNYEGERQSTDDC